MSASVGKAKASQILDILDDCSRAFTFPALDNGYVYLAATRLSAFRSESDWALVIEVFGYSPRVGLPDLHVHTFASRLHDRDQPERYVTRAAYEYYLVRNPHNESRFFHPVAEGAWQDPASVEYVAEGASALEVRGREIRLPPRAGYPARGIDLIDAERVHVFEVCRYLADQARELVLASQAEQRVSVRPEMKRLLTLDEWHHPDVVGDSLPSQSETFTQLAQVMATGDVGLYAPTLPGNTHWRYWPDGGTL